MYTQPKQKQSAKGMYVPIPRFPVYCTPQERRCEDKKGCDEKWCKGVSHDVMVKEVMLFCLPGVI
jgi:hypothetical protein